MCAGGLVLRKQITHREKGAEETKRVSKMATVMQARKPTVDRIALESEERLISFLLYQIRPFLKNGFI